MYVNAACFGEHLNWKHLVKHIPHCIVGTNLANDLNVMRNDSSLVSTSVALNKNTMLIILWSTHTHSQILMCDSQRSAHTLKGGKELFEDK